MILTNLKLNPYVGDLARWDNFNSVLINFRAPLSKLKLFINRKPHLNPRIARVIRYKCVETGIIYNSSMEAALAHGVDRNGVSKSARRGKPIGLVNLSTMHYVKISHNTRDCIITTQHYLDAGYVHCHFKKLNKEGI